MTSHKPVSQVQMAKTDLVDPQPAATDESRVTSALETYLALCDAGHKPDRDEFLKEHADIAEHLAIALEGLDFITDIAPQLHEQAGSGVPDSVTRTQGGVAIGDFVIRREIGRGGMGVVYEAEQLSLARSVALKVLPFAAVLDEHRLQRFKNEAKATATLHHPNIVPIHFVGSERGVHFYAMQLIDGQSLADVIDELRDSDGVTAMRLNESLISVGSRLLDKHEMHQPSESTNSNAVPLDSSDHQNAVDTQRDLQAAISTEPGRESQKFFQSVASIGTNVANGLSHAHECGIVHRDIKPGNLLVDRRGNTWITDFGLARLDSDAGMTVSGNLLGTIRYMSPEQALANRIVVDHRTDIYSLGATLYELLTLRPVFVGDNRQEVLRQIAFQEPQLPSAINPQVPRDLETIVLKAMAKDPQQRYGSAHELSEDLDRYLHSRPIRARRPTLVDRIVKWSRRHAASLALLIPLLTVLVLTLSVGGALLWRANAQANFARERAESNLELAMKAVEEAYLKSVGVDRLLRQSADAALRPQDSLFEAPSLSQEERAKLQRGLSFFNKIARQNPTSPQALFESGRALTRVGLIHAGLNERDEAQKAYEQAIFRLKSLTREFPNSSAYHLELGRAYYQQGKLSLWWPSTRRTFKEAQISLSRALELAPEHAEAYRLRGVTFISLSNYPSAAKDLRTALSVDPGNAVAHSYLCGVIRSPGDPEAGGHDDALHHAKIAVQLEPGNMFYRNQLADCLKSYYGDRQAAAQVWTDALEFATNVSQEYEIRSLIAQLERNYLQEVRDLDKCIELGGTPLKGSNDVASLFLRRSKAHWFLGNQEEQRRDLASAAELASSATQWNTIADSYHTLGDLDDGLAALDRSEEINPNSCDVYSARGRILAQQGRYEDAIKQYNMALALVPGNYPLYKERGRVFFDSKDYEAALSDIVKAVSNKPKDYSVWYLIDPHKVAHCPDEGFRLGIVKAASDLATKGDASGYFGRGRINAAMGREDEALDDLGRCIEILSETAKTFYDRHHLAQAYENRGFIFERRGEKQAAFDDFSECISIDCWSKHALYYRGQISKKLGQYEPAIQDLIEVMELYPSLQNAWIELAWIYALQPEESKRDFVKALEYAKRAVQFAPDGKESQVTFGYCNYYAGNYDLAIDALTKAEGMGRSGHRIAAYLAMSYWRLGKEDVAKEWYDLAVKHFGEAKQPSRQMKHLHKELLDILRVSAPPDPETQSDTVEDP